MKTESQTNFIVSFKCAFAGLRYAFQTQRNFRFHLGTAVFVLIAAYWLDVTPAAWAVLILTISCVLVVELLNTAIEVMVDIISPDYHPLAKTAKDLAAGAVLLVAITSVLVGIVIFGPPLWHLIFT
jgi:diacylglycerol kinase